MNKAYRLVWSTRLHGFVAVAETARARGKSAGAVLLAATVLALLGAPAAQADVSVASGNTKVYSGLNGVEVVDIAATNAAAVSHNLYNRFNVDSRGLVLNNNVATNGAVQSQLAGQIEGNLNLNRAARLIINEVVTQNRSQLNGYMEVAGARADVVVANPWGITCSGCGFINTDRATLTTGVPQLSSDGSLAGFRVNQGEILINGQGLNGSDQDILDLVARSIVVRGQINAKDLQLVAGVNDFAYATRSATALAASGSTPEYAIDSSLLGGMYANRIVLTATEVGVGVRSLGAVAATGSDFTLSAAGEIEIRSEISAAQDISITSQASTAQALTLDGAKLSAGRDLSLSVTQGGVKLADGTLRAERDFLLAADSLSDEASTSAQRYAAGKLQWTVAAAANLDGAQYGAGSRFDWTVGSLQIGSAGATLYSGANASASDRSLNLSATSGDLALAGASVQSPTALNLSAANGSVTVGSAGEVLADGSIALSAANAIRNQGEVRAGGQMTIQASDAAATLENSGTLQSTGNLVLGTAGHIINLDNSGTLLAGDSLSVIGGSLGNSGTVQATNGSTIQADSLSNSGSTAKWLLSTAAGREASLTLVASLTNQGILQAAGNLAVNAQGAVNNSGTLMVPADSNGTAYTLDISADSISNSGYIEGSGDTRLSATRSSGTALDNSGQIHSSGSTLALSTGGGGIGNSGQILADHALQLSSTAALAELANSGRLQSGAAMTLGGLGHLFNLNNSNAASVILAGSTLSLHGGSLDNLGTMQAASGATLTATSYSGGANSALIFSTTAGADGSLTVTGTLDNAGYLQSAGGLEIDASGQTVTNSGTVIAAGSGDTLVLTAAQLNNSGAIKSANTATLTATQGSGNSLDNSGTLYSVGALTLNTGASLNNTASGKILSDAAINIATAAASASLNNAGRIQSGAAMALGAAGHLFNLNNSNAASVILAGSTLTSHGGSLINLGTVQATTGATVTATSFTNSGSDAAFIVSTVNGGNGTLTLSGAFDNEGTVQSAGGLTVAASGQTLDNSGVIYASGSAGSLNLSGSQLTNTADGIIQGNGSLAIDTTLASGNGLDNAGTIYSKGALTVTAADDIRNSGKLLADGNLTLGTANTLAELANSGRIQSGAAMALGAAGHLFNLNNSNAASVILAGSTLTSYGGSLINLGTVQATTGATITATSFTNSGSDAAFIVSTVNGGNGTLTLGGAFDNEGTVQSAGGLTVAASGQTLDNSGVIYASGSAGSLNLSGSQLTNTADGIIQGNGSLAIDTTLASGNGLDNAGTIYSKGALTVTAADDIRNSGKLLADGNLTLGTANTLAELANSGRIQSGAAMALGAAGHLFNLNNSNTASVILAGSTLTSHGGSLINLGTVQATTGATVSATSFTNSGSDAAFIVSTVNGGNGTLTLSGAFDNEGTVQSAGGLTVAASGQTLDNSGVIYASGSAGSLNLSGSQLTNTADGIIQGNGSLAIDTTLASGNGLDNAGTIYSKGALTVTAADDIRNSGKLLADGNLTLGTANTLAELANSGRIQSGAAMALGAADHLFNLNNSNAASVILAGSTLTSYGGSLINLGTVQATTGATITATSFTNSSTNSAFIVSTVDGGDGTLTLGGNLDNYGKLQSAGGLTVNAGGNAITNRSGALISATGGSDTLSLTAGTISNSGTIQGGGTTSLNTTSTSSTNLTNNSGATLYSVGALSITVSKDVDNAGSIIGDSSVVVRTNTTASGSAMLNNSGTLQSGTSLMFLRDNNGVLDLALSNAASGMIRAGSYLYYYGNNLNNQGTMQAVTGMGLDGYGTLVNGSTTNSNALILASTGTPNSNYKTIKARSLVNYGAIHSNNDLIVQTTDTDGLVNQNTGGISSLAALTLSSGSVGNINNYGAFYSAGAMNLTATGHTIYNRQGATIDSNGTLTTSSAYFYNYAAIHVTNASITTSTYFYNGPENMPTKYVDMNNAISTSSISAYYNWVESSCAYCNELWLNQQFITYREVQSGSLPTVTPQIIANGTLTVNYGTQGVNRVGILSGDVVNLNGSSFVNEAFYLDQVVYVRRQSHYKTDCWSCSATHYYNSAQTEEDWARMEPGNAAWDPGYYGDGEFYYLPGVNSDEAAMALSLTKEYSRSNYQTVASAYVYANTLNVTGGSVTNSGSPNGGVTINSTSKNGSAAASGGMTSGASGSSATTADGATSASGSSATTTGGASGATGASSTSSGTTGTSGTSATNTGGATGANAASSDSAGPVSGTTTKTVVAADVLSKTPSIALGGLTINLPTNPNGYFVPTQNPQATYLIETNPRFSVGTAVVGSDYLQERLGYNPDTLVKRLGDANYEAYLIQQQLVEQTGRTLLAGATDEAAQVQRLMDQAANQAQSLGLVYGQALTESQVAGLTNDIVWMETVNMSGIDVLVPRVYLSAATKAMITDGAVMAGNDVNMNVTSLTNTGGTISGSNSLNITSQGDITNTSGTITGGNVSLTSTGGDIINRTLVEVNGDSAAMSTTIGKTGVISATGDLGLNAVTGNITVQGADLSAGGNATLNAGKAITFDTIVDKSSSTTASSSSGGFLESSSNTTTTATARNIGSTVTVGGTLGLTSGADTTIAGSTVSAGALAVDAKGDFNVLSRQDTTTTHSVSETAGAGVGGGVYGMETVTTDSFKGTNAASTLNVTGDAKVQSGGGVTLQGSTANIGGNADIQATQGISVLDGQDVERTTTVTETTTFLKLGTSSDSTSKAEAEADSGMRMAGAEASASAGASNENDLRLVETSRVTEKRDSTTSVGSTLNVGGDLNLTTDGTVKVQGSQVSAGGDLAIDASKTEVLAGRNEKTVTIDIERESVGFYNENNANSQASAETSGTSRGANQSASANAEASAKADSTLTAGVKVERENSTDYTLTNTKSGLSSGGNLSVKSEDATFQGADVQAGGSIDINATNISNLAVQDKHETTESKTSHLAGVYVGTVVQTQTEANASAMALGKPSAEASAGASAEATAGVRYQNKQSESSSTDITQVTNSFQAGGDITRTASGTILDQGTQMEAGGSITQSATTIRDEAVSNSSTSSSSSQVHDARIGAYVGGSAEAEASTKGTAEADATGGLGGKASYSGDIKSSSSSTTTAVTSSYKAGDNFSSTSSGQTTLTGTQIEAGNGVSLNAGSLDYQAATNTSSNSSSEHAIDAQGTVTVVGKAGGKADASYEGQLSSEESTTHTTGGIKAGGNLSITTNQDASFSGTSLESGGKTAVNAGGNIDFKAVQDTTESTSHDINAAVSVSTSKKSTGGSAEAGYSYENESTKTAVTSSITSGGGVEISSGKNVTLEGTQVQNTGGNVSLSAGGNVNLNAATSTATSNTFSVTGDAAMEKSKSSSGSEKKEAVGATLGVSNAEEVSSTTTSIQSSGKVTINAGNGAGTVTNQEATISSGNGNGTAISGKVVNKEAEESSTSSGIAVGGYTSKTTKTPAAAGGGSATGGADAGKASGTSSSASTSTSAAASPSAGAAKPATSSSSSAGPNPFDDPDL